MTGIWVDTAKAPEIRSVNDLFDPKYKGKVTMLDELRETVPLVMLAEGVDPAEATNEDWLERDRQAQGGRRLRADPPLHRQRVHRGPDRGQHRRRDRLVGRRLADRKRERRMADADRGLHAVVGKHGDPGRAPRTPPRRYGWMDFVYRAGGRRSTSPNTSTTSRRSKGVQGAAGQTRIAAREEPDGLPDRGVHRANAPTRTRRRTWNRSTRPGRKCSPGERRCDEPEAAPGPLLAPGTGPALARPLLRRADVLHGRTGAALGHADHAATPSTGPGRTSPTRSPATPSRSAAPSSTRARRRCWRC